MGQPWIAPDTPAEPRRAPVPRAVATPTAPSGRTSLAGSPVRRLHPRATSSILDGGFEVMRYRFPVVAALSALIVLPLAGVPSLLSLSRFGSSLDQSRSVPAANLGIGLTSNSKTLLAFLSQLGSALSLALVGVGIAYLVVGWLIGEDRTLGQTMRHVARRSWVVVLAWVIVAPFKGLGYVACVVGAVFTYGMFVVLSPVVSAEGLGPFASIRRCWRLSRRRLAALAWLVIVSFALNLLLGLVVLGIDRVLQAEVLDGASWAWAVTGGVTLAFRLVLTPVQGAWAALAYLDLRARTEGLDLELEAAELFGARS